MRKVLSLILGLGGGITAAMLFAPVSRKQIRSNLGRGWDEAMVEARKAGKERRAELEAQLKDMRGAS